MSLLTDIDAVVFDVDGTLLHANDPGGVLRAHPIAGAVETSGGSPAPLAPMSLASYGTGTALASITSGISSDVGTL